jgi:hypothetical protein
MTDSSNAGSGSDWEQTLDLIIAQTEAAELDLSLHSNDVGGRKQAGAFYTPADVADHAWEQFFRIHRICSADDLRAFIDHTHFVEPSAGSGIFIFAFLRKVLQRGLHPQELQAISFSVVDLSLSALRFVHRQIGTIQESLGITLDRFHLHQENFLTWLPQQPFSSIAFVGNPPYVANPKGSRWRNLFADFLQHMLDVPAEHRSVGLILPMSVCFSRDFEELRKLIYDSGLGISSANYDNIPDCLFKSGKPESSNSNKANSQRCTILMLGGGDPNRRDATALMRWSVRERAQLLGAVPRFEPFSTYDFDEQIPRPSCHGIMRYLETARTGQRLGDMLVRSQQAEFSVGAVARNFIGIRETSNTDSSVIPICGRTRDESMVLLQILASPVFYEFWRTLGDGFHVTRDLIRKFPLSESLQRSCIRNVSKAREAWSRRESFAREKLNSGKIVRSYDFRTEFNYLAAELNRLV